MRKEVGFFYREEREGARRGIYLWDWGLTARNARGREGGGFLTAKECGGTQRNVEGRKGM